MRALSAKDIFTGTNIILIGFVSYFCVSGFYKIMTGKEGSLVASTSNDRRMVTESYKDAIQPLSYYNQIISRNLFNTMKTVVKKTDQLDLEKLKKTDLKLKLWGTVTSQAGSTYAVIEASGKNEQNLYRVGDSINNAEIKLVLREKVVLLVDGRDEVLAMEKVTASPLRSTSLASRSSYQGAPSPAMKITLQKSQIDEAMENITDLMGQIKVRPHFQNGVPDGIMLSSIQPRSIFRRMGLRSGDVITGVDGKNIESVDDALKFYENLSSSDSLKLQLKRMGKERSIEYTIK